MFGTIPIRAYWKKGTFISFLIFRANKLLMNVFKVPYVNLMRQREQDLIAGILNSLCDFIPSLVQLVNNDEDLIMIPAFQTIVLIVSNCNEPHKGMVLNSGLLPIWPNY